MKLKTLSLYADFLRLFHKKGAEAQNDLKLGNLRVSRKLLNTHRLSAEGKLTYAYLFHQRRDVTGITVPSLSTNLGIPPRLVRQTLKELELKRHIRLVTAQPSANMSEVVYYYNIVDPKKYGLPDVENA
ncbi:MAG: hypothetical protein ACYTBJ_09540 [Planctomycetota bacterium]|jgi:hypothetical protein